MFNNGGGSYTRPQITFVTTEEDILHSIQAKWNDPSRIEDIKGLVRGLIGLVSMRRPWIASMVTLHDSIEIFRHSFSPMWESKLQLNKTLGDLYPFMMETRYFWEPSKEDREIEIWQELTKRS